MSTDPGSRPAPTDADADERAREARERAFALALRPGGARLPDEGLLDRIAPAEDGMRLPARVGAGVLGAGVGFASLLLGAAGLGAMTGTGSLVHQLPVVLMTLPGVWVSRLLLRAAFSRGRPEAELVDEPDEHPTFPVEDATPPPPGPGALPPWLG